RNAHRIRISTLDSLFTQLATTHSLELGLPPGWRILEDLDDQQLRQRAIEESLREDADRDIPRLLHLMTQGEVDRSVNRLLTDTVRDLYALFLETDADAWKDFPKPSFLNSTEVADIIEQLAAETLEGRMATARNGDVTLAREEAWTTFIGKGLAAKVLSGDCRYYSKPIPAPTVALYQRLLDHVAQLQLAQIAQQTEATYELLARFHKVYCRIKADHGALRFDDVTRSIAASLRESNTDISSFDFRMDSRVFHVLLDEFQDTSLPQWQALRPYAERASQVSPHRVDARRVPQSFFCVGDEKQAIYGWRGARAEIFAALQQHLKSVKATSLDRSHRSAPEVIASVNRIFQGLTRHPNLDRYADAVTAWSGNFPEHTTAKTGVKGYVTLETAPQANDGQKDSDVTLAYAADRIAQLVAQCPGRSIGVLARRNDAVARMIFELRRRNIPASEEGGNPLTDSVAVQAIMALMQLADHPADSVARFHVATSPLGEIVGLRNHNDAPQALAVSARVRQELLEQGYGPVMDQWVKQLAPHLTQRDFTRLDQLIESAYAYQSRATLRPADFVRHVQSNRIADPLVAPVRVMTVHQAKGLQFDIVVLPDLDAQMVGQNSAFVVRQPDPTSPIDRVCLYRNTNIQSLLPPDIQRMFSIDSLRRMTESLCVLYVALTRPIRALHMIIAPASPSEKNLPRTHAGLLRAALADTPTAPPNTLLYSHGPADWHQSDTPPPIPAIVPQSPPQVALAPMKEGRRSGLERTAPSSLEGGDLRRIDDLLSSGESAAKEKGTVIHAWLQEIRWLETGIPDDTALRQLAAEHASVDFDVEAVLRQFRAMLQSPELRDLLSEPNYRHRELAPGTMWFPAKRSPESWRLDVKNERTFAIEHHGRMIAGSIDRLLLIYDGQQLVAAEILDYKTDAIPRDDRSALQHAIDRYRPQQQAYREAVAAIYGIPLAHIRARLVFLATGQIVSI
ncbi:MAG: ATP-dependent helicase/nuclease subunit, partial [Planctomycetota bacterium]